MLQTIEKAQESLSYDIFKKSSKDDKYKGRVWKKPGKGVKEQEYLKLGGVAMSMNDAFTPFGWDVKIKKLKVVTPPYRVDNMGKKDEKGQYWACDAYCVVRVVTTVMIVNKDGFVQGKVKTKREDVAAAGAIGGKAKTSQDALHGALSTAVSQAMKRCCKLFGPATGLTLGFDPADREDMQRWFEAQAQEHAIGSGLEVESVSMNLSDDPEVATEEATLEKVAAEEVATEVVAEASTEAVVVETVATSEETVVETVATRTEETIEDTAVAVDEEAGQDKTAAEILNSVISPELLGKIWSLPGNDGLQKADMNAVHNCLKTTYGGKAALGIWRLAGVALGPNAKVTKGVIAKVSQILEEAAAGVGGIDAFVAQFDPPPPPAEPVAAEPVAEHVPEAPTQVPDGVMPEGNGLHDPNDMSMGAQLEEMFQKLFSGNDPETVREYFTEKFGSGKDDVIEHLVSTPDGVSIPKSIMAALHAIGTMRLKRLNSTDAEVFKIWRRAGVEIKGGPPPTGNQARRFAFMITTT